MQSDFFPKFLMNLRDFIPQVPSVSIAIGTKLYSEESSALYLAIFLLSAWAATEPGETTAIAL